MAKIQGKTQKIFGQNGNNDEFAVFGSMKTSPSYSKDVETLQGGAAFLLGWQNAVIAGYAPFLEEMNGICYMLSYQIAYLLQAGIPEWNAGTTYYTGSFCQVSGVIYKSLSDDNINNDPTNDTVNWQDTLGLKANIDLSNVTATGTSTGAAWALPSNVYNSLTIGASGSTYTAPANGWFWIAKPSNNLQHEYVEMVSFTPSPENNLILSVRGTATSNFCVAIIPVRKNDVMTLSYTAGGTSEQQFRFIYAEGSKSEYTP